MSHPLRLFLMALTILMLVACSSKQAKDGDSAATGGEQGSGQQADTQGLGDGSGSQVGALDDPSNILSKRTILFDFDRSVVKGEFQELVAAHAQYLANNTMAKIVLEGHADERGTREYNLGLGERRSNAVAKLMMAQGASSSQIEVVSYGEERPAAMCHMESCWYYNRRVEIVYTHR